MGQRSHENIPRTVSETNKGDEIMRTGGTSESTSDEVVNGAGVVGGSSIGGGRGQIRS